MVLESELLVPLSVIVRLIWQVPSPKSELKRTPPTCVTVMLNAPVVSFALPESVVRMFGLPLNVHRRPSDDGAVHPLKLCVTCAENVPASGLSVAVPLTVALPPFGQLTVCDTFTVALAICVPAARREARAAGAPGSSSKAATDDIASSMSYTSASESFGAVESPQARVRAVSATEAPRRMRAVIMDMGRVGGGKAGQRLPLIHMWTQIGSWRQRVAGLNPRIVMLSTAA